MRRCSSSNKRNQRTSVTALSDSQDKLVTPSRPRDRPSNLQDRSVTPSGSQDRVRRTEDNSPTITQDSSSSRIDHLTPRLEVLECSDDRVLARWKDGQWYPGTIQDNLDNGKYVYNSNDCGFIPTFYHKGLL